jgi:hypothetical protein
MNLRHRAMQPGDIPECVDIVANHPVIGPRYGPAIKLLPEAWLRILQCEARIAAVICAGEGGPICVFGVTAMVRDNFLRELKTPPHFWFGPELTRRIIRGESPLLTGKQLRDANSRDGLNLVCWEGCVRPEYEGYGEVPSYMVSAFIQDHRGYLWKEVISSQSWRTEHLDFVLKSGGRVWDAHAGAYTSSWRTDLSEIVSKPHIVGVTRDLALSGDSWAGSWVGALFDYHAPRLGFNRSEQRLLSCAIPGATDEQLAGTLETSLPAVKKRWVSIYRRVEDHLPELIPDPLRSDLPAIGRGKEKRRSLLSYLREHPEELRPVSSKLLAESRTKLRVAAT